MPVNQCGARRSRPHRPRSGLTLVEILVGVAVAAILAAFVIPTVSGRLTDAAERREASDLTTLAQAINTYHDQVGAWPSTLTQLVTQPSVGDLNICGGSLAAKDVNRWLGPYVTMPIPSTGIVIGGSTISNTLSEVTTSSPSVIQISLTNVSSATFTDIQNMLDNDASSTTGTIRWDGSSVLTYNLPIAGC